MSNLHASLDRFFLEEVRGHASFFRELRGGAWIAVADEVVHDKEVDIPDMVSLGRHAHETRVKVSRKCS